MKQHIYILRHGETAENKAGIVQGQGIDSNLNALGIQQAELFYKKYQEVKFDYIICSAQKRSYQTIQKFETVNQKIYRDDRINEISWGEHEGKAGEPELLEKYYKVIHEWQNENYHAASIGAESAYQLESRLEDFLSDLKLRTESKILICTHGRTLRAMVCLLTNQKLSNMESIPHANTGLYVFEKESNNWTIVEVNNTSHLIS